MPLAVTFPLSGRFGDLHPLEYVRAGRTTTRETKLISLVHVKYLMSYHKLYSCVTTIGFSEKVEESNETEKEALVLSEIS